MLSLKPTTIIALDRHAAALCAAVGERVKRESEQRGSFLQFRALRLDGGHVRLDDLAASAAAGTDFIAVQGGDVESSISPAGYLEVFRRDTEEIESAVAELLRKGQSFTERQEALRAQVQIAEERVIYLVLSSRDPFACGVILELIRLARFLFSRRFADELFTLHAVVLMPDLFPNPSRDDFATTYALLKKLDDAALSGVDVGARQRVQPLDSCWLLDGRNAKGITLGTLDEELDSYADACAGFLAAEPERSGALPGTRTSRGRPPAYSSFGYGELFLPTEEAMSRLCAALARDIIARAYAPEEPPRTDNDARRLLLAATRFIRGKGYVDALEGLEREEGAPIWKPLRQSAEARDSAAAAYVTELQLRHADFERKDLTRFRETLGARKEGVLVELLKLLDDEIDSRADASPAGLSDALAFLRVMSAPGIVMREDLLNEEPQNLFTEFGVAAAALDQRLGVSINRQATVALLEEARSLRGNLHALQVSLRLASPAPGEQEEGRGESRAPSTTPGADETDGAATAVDAGGASGAGEGVEDRTTAAAAGGANPATDNDPRRIAEEIEAAERQLRKLEVEYPRAADREERAADRERREAAKRVEQEKAEAVARAEAEVVAVGEKLRDARFALDELKRERRQYLQRLLVFYPSILGMLFVGVPLLAALGDIGPARDVVAFVWENSWNFLLGFLAAAALYLGVVFLVLTRDIHRRIREAGERVESLFNSFNAAAAHLLGARNDQLNFEYRLYAQKLRAETFQDLIVAARERGEQLERTLGDLRRLGEDFAREHDDAVPQASIMRRPLLTTEDIDAYYLRTVADAGADAATFSRDRVSRSRARRTPIEEFRARLTEYARGCFDALTKLSVEEVLLGRHDLLPQNAALIRLRELDDTAEPLLRLRDRDASADNVAERDVTLWVSGEQRGQILSLYHRISPGTTDLASEDKRSLRVLQRCLNFPAYFLGLIEHYRSCYERQQGHDAAEYPDIIPVEGEARRAREQVLLALALGLCERRSAGGYALAGGDPGSPGRQLREIADELANKYASQSLYSDLQSRVAAQTTDHAVVYEKLKGLLPSETGLDEVDREILTELIERYHPLG